MHLISLSSSAVLGDLGLIEYNENFGIGVSKKKCLHKITIAL